MIKKKTEKQDLEKSIHNDIERVLFTSEELMKRSRRDRKTDHRGL